MKSCPGCGYDGNWILTHWWKCPNKGDPMSMDRCELCDKIIDTDIHLETDGDGHAICNHCAEEFEKNKIRSIEFVYHGVIITLKDGSVKKYQEK